MDFGLYSNDILVRFVGAGAGHIQLAGNDEGPFSCVRDTQQAIFAGRDLRPADGDGITEGEGSGLVCAGTPHFTEWHQVTEDLTSFYAGPRIGQFDGGKAEILFYILRGGRRRGLDGLSDGRQVKGTCKGKKQY